MPGFIWNNWLLIALVPPLLYAVVALFDAWFVEREVFRTAREATIVSALFGAIPLVLPATGMIEIRIASIPVSLVAVLSGAVFTFHGYFYVAALLKRNDTVLAETIQNLSVLFVPVLAYFLVGERLSRVHYTGIFFAAVAVLVMYRVSHPGGHRDLRGCWQLIISMLLFSLVLVAGDWTYNRMDFWSGFMLFTLGVLATALVMFLFGEKTRILRLLGDNWKVFLLVEGITTLGILCSLRAVDISPSATFVAITECLGAYFILGISLVVFWSGHVTGVRLGSLSIVCSRQLDDYPGKIAAGVLVSSGIWLVYGT
jgi:drug/metabolite transporter (DMT)-like permease